MEGGNMTRDQFLCEEVLGECWHEADYMLDGKWDSACQHFYVLCRKCRLQLYSPDKTIYNPNFSLWPDKGRLIDFVMGQEWWGNFGLFSRNKWQTVCDDGKHWTFAKYLLDNFADLVAEYRGWKE